MRSYVRKWCSIVACSIQILWVDVVVGWVASVINMGDPKIPIPTMPGADVAVLAEKADLLGSKRRRVAIFERPSIHARAAQHVDNELAERLIDLLLQNVDQKVASHCNVLLVRQQLGVLEDGGAAAGALVRAAEEAGHMDGRDCLMISVMSMTSPKG